ncbi:MAG: hypothetical protein ABEJ55_03765 [Halanaeroarchaeum sp.]
MSRDATLDAFVSTSDGDETAAEDGEQSTTEGDERSDDVRVTSTWTPDGAACERCGSEVARRWRDGHDVVCAACKEWRRE